MNLAPLKLRLWLENLADSEVALDTHKLREAFLEGQKLFKPEDFTSKRLETDAQGRDRAQVRQYQRAVFEEDIKELRAQREAERANGLGRALQRLRRADMEFYIRMLEAIMDFDPGDPSDTRTVGILCNLLVQHHQDDPSRVRFNQTVDRVLKLFEKHNHPDVQALTDAAEALGEAE